MFSQCLKELWRDPKPTKQGWICMAYITGCMDALEQSAINNGSWSNAWYLTLMPELEKQRKWAGDKKTMRTVAEYRESVAKMQKQSGTAIPPGGQLSGATGSGTALSARAKKRAKKKEREEAERKAAEKAAIAAAGAAGM